MICAFDRDLFPLLEPGEVIEDSPFTFGPNVDGHWVATTPSSVAFEPAQPPAPGRTYTVGLKADHPLFHTVHIDADTLPTMLYRPLNLRHVRLDRSDVITLEDGTPARRSVIEMTFNQDVASAACAQHVQVETVTGHSPTVIKATWTGDALSTSPRFEVVTAPGTTLRITTKPELTGHGGELPLGKQMTSRVMIPVGLAVINADTNEFRWGYRNPEVGIRFNRQLSATQKSPNVNVTPDIGPVSARISGRNIYLSGQFVEGVDYQIEIEPPLLATDGSLLFTTAERSIRIPKGRPAIAFPRYSGRLGTQGAFELDLSVRHVNEAQLRIFRLLDRHVPIYLADVLDKDDVPRLGEQIVDTTLHLNPKGRSGRRDVAIALDGLMDQTPGIYRVEIDDVDSRWTRDSMLLFVGDLTIDVQTHASGMLAWVTNTRTGQPVEGATVTAWSTNRVELETVATDHNGVCRLSTTRTDSDLVTASFKGDLIFIHPRTAKGISDRALSGAAWAGPLDIAMYADRGVHRPGETIHLSGLVRTATGDVPGALPLEVRFTRPDQKVMAKHLVTTGPAQSMFHIDLPTSGQGMTGNWRASVHLAGDDKTIASLICPVMPVLPVRLKVEATAVGADQSKPMVQVVSTYLHGAAAAGLPATVITTFTPQRYSSARFSTFRFENPPSNQVVKRLQKATLADDGTITFDISPPSAPAVWKGVCEATVSELGGRATTARTRVDTDTASTHLGLKASAGKLYRPTDTIALEAIAINTAGSLLTSGTIGGTLVRIDNEWQLTEQSNGRYTWRSVELATPITNVEPAFVVGDDDRWSCVIPALPNGTYRFTATARVEISGAIGPPMSVDIPIHVSAAKATGRMAANRPDRLELIAEHDLVTPGMDTSVLIRTPFPGLALVTTETNEITQTQVIHIDGDGARVAIHVPESARDTCFVGATLLRPLDPTRTQWLPLRARGAARLHIDRAKHELATHLYAVNAARPGDRVHVTLEVPDLVPMPEVVSTPTNLVDTLGQLLTKSPPLNGVVTGELIAQTPESPTALVHLWAVEEGALLLTDYTVPNLVSSFLRARRREVAAATTIDALLPDYQRPESIDRIGSDVARRFRSPVPIRQRDIEVLWHTSMPLPETGVLEFDLTMPKIDGAMRIMAVVVDSDRFGRTEHLVGVTSPLDFTAALPRAVAPGDTMRIPLTVHNRQDMPVELALEAMLGHALTGSISPATITVPAGGSAKATLDLTASGLGHSAVHLTATPTAGESAALSGIIAVRPPHGRVRDVVRMRVNPGDTIAIERRSDLDALNGHIDIVVSGLPSIDLGPVIQELIDYPWGCAEQTGSRTQGLLAALRLPKEVTGLDAVVIRDLATSGFEQLFQLQNPNGSIGYWRGQRGDRWITMRTALLALDAQEQGVAVPDGLLNGLLTWTAAHARKARNDNLRNDAAMACRILARSNEPDEALLKSLAANPETLPALTRAHLADAAAALGDLELANALLRDIRITQFRHENQRFHSTIHTTAVVLDVLLRNNLDHASTIEFVRQVDDSRNARGWRTTFENAASVQALARWYEATDTRGTAKGTLHIAGRDIAINGNDTVRHSFDVEAISADQTERITATGDGAITVLISTSGVPAKTEDLPALESVIRVRRVWRDALGNPIWVNTPVQAGDLITVDLSVESVDGSRITDVALLDVLPGCMEFELPSLATSAGRSNFKMADVDRVEFRDDRVVAFLTVDGHVRHLQYVIRAVVPGEFVIPAVDALAMYDPDGHGRSTSSHVTVSLP